MADFLPSQIRASLLRALVFVVPPTLIWSGGMAEGAHGFGYWGWACVSFYAGLFGSLTLPEPRNSNWIDFESIRRREGATLTWEQPYEGIEDPLAGETSESALAQLERLEKLRDQGELTQAEYAAAEAEILRS